MVTNIDIDDKKIKAIMKMAGIKTKKEAVNLALDELLRILSARELLKMKGSFCWEGDLDQIRED